MHFVIWAQEQTLSVGKLLLNSWVGLECLKVAEARSNQCLSRKFIKKIGITTLGDGNSTAGGRLKSYEKYH